jgi:3-hydroxyisobutyrate dehydrogenase-like beta-hydroxyacid dehydrogenase
MDTANARTRPRLGFIGMGGMGSRMAARLLAAGYDVTIYNRARERTQQLAERGATVAATPAELAADVDVVLSSLADDAAVDSVMTGLRGALAAARPGTIFIEMSTVSPATSRRLYEAGHRRELLVLDAPVSGTTAVAEQGQLIIFVGGEHAVYDRCKTILSVLGETSFYMGATGSGAMMKLCANTMLALGMQALAEAVTLGLKAGLPRERLLNALGNTAVVSPSQKSKFENVSKGVYPPAFPLRLMYKDLKLILQTAGDLLTAMPMTTVAEQVYVMEAARQVVAGRDEDFSSVVRATQQMTSV